MARYVRFIKVICATRQIAVTRTVEVVISRVAKSSPTKASNELVNRDVPLPNLLPDMPVTPDGPQSKGPGSQCSVYRQTNSV